MFLTKNAAAATPTPTARTVVILERRSFSGASEIILGRIKWVVQLLARKFELGKRIGLCWAAILNLPAKEAKLCLH